MSPRAKGVGPHLFGNISGICTSSRRRTRVPSHMIKLVLYRYICHYFLAILRTLLGPLVDHNQEGRDDITSSFQ
jgi:hypothetical protein